jgi:hypothetical protein
LIHWSFLASVGVTRVVFESMAEAIIPGREELGWSKVYADISDVQLPVSDAELSVRWDEPESFTSTMGRHDPRCDGG